MSNEDEQALFSNALDGLIHKPVWKAARYHGSCFFLDMGDQVPRTRKIKGPPSRTEAVFEGEYFLDVSCAAWRLDSDHDGVITSWADDPTPAGPMERGIQMLVGRQVNKAQLLSAANNLHLAFDGGLHLRVFCDELNPNLENYEFRNQAHFFAVEAKGTLVVESRSEADPRGAAKERR